MNNTTRFFQTKQQYKDFRKAFAAAQNDKTSRKTYTQDTGTRWNDETRSKETYSYKTKHVGWLSSAHYLLFNLVTGKNYYNGFSPKTKETFISSGGIADRGLNKAIATLSNVIESAQMLLGQIDIYVPLYFKDNKQSFITDKMKSLQAIVNTFLLPFGGVFTLQNLARVQLPGLTDEQVKQKLTYKQAFGEQIADQTPQLGVPS